MKKLIVLSCFMIFTGLLMAQGPPPPNGNGGAPDGGNIPVGGSAPVGSGIIVMMTLAAAWGSKKVFGLNIQKQKEIH